MCKRHSKIWAFQALPFRARTLPIRESARIIDLLYLEIFSRIFIMFCLLVVYFLILSYVFLYLSLVFSVMIYHNNKKCFYYFASFLPDRRIHFFQLSIPLDLNGNILFPQIPSLVMYNRVSYNYCLFISLLDFSGGLG